MRDKETTESLTDDKLLTMLKENDSQAMQKLIDVFGERFYALSKRILNNEEDARESVQETFMIIWEKWPSFKGNSKFSSWVHRIAANAALMKLRKIKKQRRNISIDQFNTQLSNVFEKELHIPNNFDLHKPVAPDKLLENVEFREMVNQLILELPDHHRIAYTLKDIEGMSIKEISEIIEESEAAVKSRVHRARKELREKLKKKISEMN